MAKKLKDEDLVLNIIINGNKSKKEMNELERAITDTNREINTLKKVQKDLIAQGKKETDAYRATVVAINEKNKAIALAEARLTELRKGMKLTEMSITDLRKEQQRLNKLLNTATPGSANALAYQKQLDAVSGRLSELKTKAVSTGFTLKGMADKFNHYIGVVTAGVVTLIGLLTGINKIVTTFAEFDDKVADVQKTTGLLKGEVLELNKELQQIDTRTSQENLLGLARVAGKLGISAKEDILGFVRASDQIGVALAEDLGGDVEEAINSVGKLVDIFNLKKEFGIEQGLLKVGSAINTLGAKSTANEGYLVNFSNRMAGVAPLAGITIDQILGLGATLDQFGQTSEVSSTALSKLFMKMAADAKTYSKYAGQSVDEFKQNLEKDFMGTFIRVLEGVKKSSGGINELVETLGDLGEDGGRVVGVLGVLANNTGTLRQQLDIANQSFREGTSLTEEFGIKNETAGAQLEKARKVLYNLTIDLGEKLYGAVTLSTNGFSYLVKSLSALISFIIEHKRVIAITLAALIGYNAVILIQNTLLAVNNNETKLSIALAKLKVFWDRALTASTHLLGAAYMALTGRMAAAKAEMVLFNNIAKINPWAALIGAIVAIGVAIYSYTQKLTAAQKVQKEFNDLKVEASKSTIKETGEIERLQAILQSETATRDDKLRSMIRLKELMGDHLKGYADETIMAGKAAGAIALYVKELQKKALVEQMTNRIAQKQTENIELQNSTTTGGLGGTLNQGFQSIYGFLGFQGRVKKLQGFAKDENKKIIDDNEVIITNLNNSLIKLMQSGYDTSSIEGMQKYADEMSITLSKLKKGSKEYNQVRDEIKALNTKIAFKKANPVNDGADVDLGESEKDKKARLKAEREALAASNKQRKADLDAENLAYQEKLKAAGLFGLQKNLMTAEQLEQLAALEKEHQEKISAINEKGNKVAIEKTSQALAEIKKRQEAEKAYRESLRNPDDELIVQENQAHAQRLEKAGLFGKEREKLTSEQLEALETLEAIHRNKLASADAKLIADHLQKKQQAFETELAQLRYKNHQELGEVTSLEKGKQLLVDRLSKEELKKITTIGAARKALKEAQLKEENAITVKYGTDLMNQLKAAIDSGVLNFSDLKLSDKILSPEEFKMLEGQFLKLAEMMAALKDPTNAKEINEGYSFGKSNTDILGFAAEDWDYFFDNLSKGKFGIGELALAVGALTQAWSIYDQYKTQTENRELKKYEESANAQKEALQKKLDTGKISQSKYNADVAKLDKDLDAKKQKIEEQQAARQKVLAVGNIISSTAQAIMSIWAQVPKFDFGISAGILTGIVSAVGAAQLGMVMGLEEGGYVTRAQDGKQFKAKNQGNKRGYIDETSVLVSENGKEFVASAAAVANPEIKQVLDMIDSAQRNGNVSTLTLEKMMYTSSASRKMNGKEVGGYVSVERQQAPSDQNANDLLLIEYIQLMKKLNEKLDKPLAAEVYLTGKNGFVNKMNEFNSLVNTSQL